MMKLRQLSRDLQEVAISELNEVPSRLEEDVKHIQEWAKKQSHFNIVPGSQLIVAFLRGTKFSLEQTKKKLEMYYTMRSVNKSLYLERNPFSAEIQELFKAKSFARLPSGNNPLAPLRIFGAFKKIDADKISLVTVFKSLFMVADIYLHESDRFIVNGQECIFDFENLPYTYLGQISPQFLKGLAVLSQDAYPLRIRGVYLINVLPILIPFINTFKSLLSKKLADRIHCFAPTNLENLYKMVPQSVLPEEYGGDAGTLEMLSNELQKVFEEHEEFFKNRCTYCTEESKRVRKIELPNGLYGSDGSFRKLDLD